MSMCLREALVVEGDEDVAGVLWRVQAADEQVQQRAVAVADAVHGQPRWRQAGARPSPQLGQGGEKLLRTGRPSLSAVPALGSKPVIERRLQYKRTQGPYCAPNISSV